MNTFFLYKIKKQQRIFFSLNFLLSLQNKIDDKDEEVVPKVSSLKYKDDKLKSKYYYKKISTII